MLFESEASHLRAWHFALRGFMTSVNLWPASSVLAELASLRTLDWRLRGHSGPQHIIGCVSQFLAWFFSCNAWYWLSRLLFLMNLFQRLRPIFAYHLEKKLWCWIDNPARSRGLHRGMGDWTQHRPCLGRNTWASISTFHTVHVTAACASWTSKLAGRFSLTFLGHNRYSGRQGAFCIL